MVIVVAIIFSLFYNKYTIEYGSNLKYADLKPFKDVWMDKDDTGTTYRNVMYNMMRITCDILSKNGIKPVLIFGTLLGHSRHNDLIPWDDDVDICVSDLDMDRILSLKEFARYNLEVKFIPKLGILKVFDTTRPIIPLHGTSWPFIDIFPYSISNKDKVVISGAYSVNTFNVADMFPLKPAIFAKQVQIYVPNDIDSILSATYGNDYSDTCVSSSWNHRDEKIIPKQYKTLCQNAIPKIDDKIFDNVYVINLERRPDRWEKTKDRLNDIGIEPKRWIANDGKSDPSYQKYRNNSKLSPSEAACFDSHVNLWKYIYNNNIPNAIIFEDDIFITGQVTRDSIVSDIKSNGGFEIFFLGHIYASLDKFTDTSAKIGTALGLHAYVLNRGTIKKLLDKIQDKKVPIDVITEEHCKSNLCFLSRHNDSNANTSPTTGLIHQDFNIDSDLEVERALRRVIGVSQF